MLIVGGGYQLAINLDDVFTLLPDVRVIILDEDTVEVRRGVWNVSATIFRDDDNNGHLAGILRGILGQQPVRDISKALHVSEDSVKRVIHSLLTKRLVMPRPLRGYERIQMMSGFTVGLATQELVKPTKVILIAPPFTRPLLHQLLKLPAMTSLEYMPDEIVNRLERQDFSSMQDSLSSAGIGTEFRDLKGSHVVAVTPTLEPILFRNLNWLAHLLPFTWMPASVDGPFVLVGPTTIPPHTACYHCAEQRVIENLKDHVVYQRYRDALTAGQVFYSSDDSLDPLWAMTLTLAAWDCMNMAVLGNGFTVGKILTMHAATWEYRFHEVLRVPGCPTCSPASPHTSPTFTDLKTLIRKLSSEMRGS